MREEYEATLHGLEDSHWYFQARRDLILRLVDRLSLNAQASILDIGCSAGVLMARLGERNFTDVHGIDISTTAIQLAHERGITNTQLMNAAGLEFPDDRFDLLIASDVLEHINDQHAALSSWLRVLRPGGVLVIAVPAFHALWSNHDDVNQHYRRYTLHSLVTELQAAGFEVTRGAYWNFFLFIPVGMVRLILRLLPNEVTQSTQLSRTNRIVNALLFNLIRIENVLLASGVDLPFGISTWALARKG